MKNYVINHIIEISWWSKNMSDNNLLDTLKKHSQFQKCEILKLWKFKVCTHLKIHNFTTSKVFYQIWMGYNVHDVLKIYSLYYIKFTFKILTFFGMISNYHHFSRWNIRFAKNLYIFTNSYLFKND